VCLICVCQTPPGGLVGCSSPCAPLEGSTRVWPWGSQDTQRRGLSHAPPPGGVTRLVTTRPRLMPGALSQPTGVIPHISPTSGPASRGTGGGISPPPSCTRGKPRHVTQFQSAPGGSLRGALRRGTDGFTEPGKPRVNPIRWSPLAVTGGFDSPGGTLFATGRTTPSGTTGFFLRPELFLYPTLGWDVLLFPVSVLLRRDCIFCGSRRSGRLGGRS